MNIPRAKGIKAGKEIRKSIIRHFNKIGWPIDDRDIDLLDVTENNVRLSVERSEQAKIRERKKRAEKHKLTVDMFEQNK